MATPVEGPLGAVLASLTNAAEEAAEAAVDAAMEEPARTLAVASTHLAVLITMLADEDTRAELSPEVADVVRWTYQDAGEVMDAALLAVTEFLGTP